jgi:hypothetical protein
MRFIHWIVFFFILVTPAFQTTHAQSNRRDVIFLRQGEAQGSYRNIPERYPYGDLYAWTPGSAEPVQLTTWGYNRAPVLSPDGTKLVYGSVPQFVIDQGEDYFFDYGWEDPINIWMMDVATRQFRRIADQPADAQGKVGLTRSDPVWSPDSQRVAWFETTNSFSEGIAPRIAVYDFASGETQYWGTGLSMGFLDGGNFQIPSLGGWGSHIAHTIFTHGLPVGPDPGLVLYLHDQGGLERTEAISWVTVQETVLKNLRWVKHQGAWWLALEYPGSWQIMNADTGEQQALVNPPLLQLTSGQGLRVRQIEGAWEIFNEAGYSFIVAYDTPDVYLAPDGLGVVFLVEGTPRIWLDTHSIERLLPESTQEWYITGMVWSPMEWVTDGQAEPEPLVTPPPIPTPGRG